MDRTALLASVECGGWCPEGRLAEDGIIPERYPVIELKGAGYKQRTLQNVIDSNGTLIIYFNSLSGGTEQTTLFCIEQHKPYLLIDASEIPICRTVKLISDFVTNKEIRCLNIAGPRISSTVQAYDYTFEAISRFLTGIHAV